MRSSSSFGLAVTESVTLLMIEEIPPSSVMALHPTTVSKGSASSISGDLSANALASPQFPLGIYNISIVISS